MTTVKRVQEALATAQSLHATLSAFALETLDPTTKTMWSELATSSQFIAKGIQMRSQQLQNREAAMHPVKES